MIRQAGKKPLGKIVLPLLMEVGKSLNSFRESLINSLRKPLYRHAWVESHIKDGIAFQIRSMRKARGWDQTRLAIEAFNNPDLQSMVSRYESSDYGKYSLRTLLDLAKTFDVGLIVRFAPFSELIHWEEEEFSKAENPIPSFDQELNAGLLEDRGVIDTSDSYRYYRPVVVPNPGTVQITFVPSGASTNVSVN
jgi:transcriptional regulator with XRE-family HTH domain